MSSILTGVAAVRSETSTHPQSSQEMQSQQFLGPISIGVIALTDVSCKGAYVERASLLKGPSRWWP
jgi:hypothetical protein